MSVRRWALMLAVMATTTALSLSILAGWQRGGTLQERLIWIAIGTVLVTSAHLLPALIRDVPIVIRGVGSVLWGACLATACYGHTVFFVFAQQHAGAQRASTVQVASVTPPARSLTTVMAERASVTAQLATANARYCAGNCASLEGRRVTLAAKMEALNAEADDIRRQQAATDRLTAQHDAPPAVTMTANVTQSVVTGATDATQSVVVPVEASHADKTVSRNPVTPGRGSTTRSHAPRNAPVTPLPVGDPIDDHLTQLVRDIAAGLVRPTVTDIRRHLGCSQARAVALRRQLAERNVAA
ncbi:hypothetical protein JAO05_28240 [Burkholderia pseudomallei]|uniref:hypothetical protein n=1 Tax=Burkholderia pseudomallei TaxID=28450 RepID=UPI000A1A20F0|nr:hypothetical protein [Burkholderia pseudomallei]ARL99142.1 hypothetical protein BOC59_02665 [Burkholderia pseudomallei]MBH9658990.1 hypothetical protein [Burkholderia pseudomallei]